MDIEQIKKEERILEQKQSQLLFLAKEICTLKKNVNQLEIENVAQERQIKDLEIKVTGKRIELQVLQGQVTFLQEACQKKRDEEQRILEAMKESKRAVWGKYKALVNLANKEEAKVRSRIGTEEKSTQKQEVTTPVDVLAAEIELMKEFLQFQEHQKSKILKFIAKNETAREIQFGPSENSENV